MVKFIKNNNYKSDAKAFLFSLTYEQKIKQKNQNQTYAIYDNSGRMPTWGGGHDLTIYSPCNTSNSSYTKPYYTYYEPDKKGLDGVDDKTFMAGAYNFQLKELEIW